jgi:hypothetical protein
MRRWTIFAALIVLIGGFAGTTYWVSQDRSRCSRLPDYLRAIVCPPSVIDSMDFKKGEFIGLLEVRFFSTKSGDGHPIEMIQLLKPFAYKDSRSVLWEVPEGFLSDGASIPDYLWASLGGPYSGPYRDAAVIHDFFCYTKSRKWEDVHDVFLEAALNRGTSARLAQTLYFGILLGGPRWPSPKSGELLRPITRAQVTPTPPSPPAPQPKGGATKTDAQIFEELKAWIEKERPTREEIRKRIEELRKQRPVPAKK